jgi:hypothetical protein
MSVNNGFNSQNVPIPGDPDFQEMYSRLFGTSTAQKTQTPTSTMGRPIPPGTMTLWDRIAQSGVAGTPMVGMSNIPATTTATGGPLPAKTPAKTPAPVAPTPTAPTTGKVQTPADPNAAIKAGGQAQAAAMGVNLAGAKTPEELNPQNQMAADAARAGMSASEYMALNTLSKEESDRLANELGITDTENALFKRPSETTEALYTRLYDTTGLGDLKTQISTIMKEVNTERQTALEALGQVNENPWLSEKSRVGRGKRLLEQLEARIGNRLNEIERLNSLYTMGMGEIDRVIQRRTADFTQDQTVNTAKLNYLNAKMEKRTEQILSKRKTEGLGAFADEKQKQAEKDKQTQQGDKLVTVGDTVFYWDPVTKKLVEVGQGKDTPRSSDTPSSYKEWVLAGKPGTYADWVNKGSTSTPSSEEVKQFIRKQIATPEFKSLSLEEQKDYILSVGGDPMDYEIY